MTRLDSPALLICAAALFSGVFSNTIAAQGRHVFAIDQSQSAFAFSGSIIYLGISGPIIGSPASFNISGAADIDLTVDKATWTPTLSIFHEHTRDHSDIRFVDTVINGKLPKGVFELDLPPNVEVVRN